MLSRAHRTLERDTGDQKFVYEGQEYYCVPSTFSRDTSLAAGGWEGTVQFTLSVRVSNFPAWLTADMTTVSADDSGDLTADADNAVPPSAGKKITFPAPPLPGREYRVFKRNVPAVGGVFELILGSSNR